MAQNLSEVFQRCLEDFDDREEKLKNLKRQSLKLLKQVEDADEQSFKLDEELKQTELEVEVHRLRLKQKENLVKAEESSINIMMKRIEELEVKIECEENSMDHDGDVFKEKVDELVGKLNDATMPFTNCNLADEANKIRKKLEKIAEEKKNLGKKQKKPSIFEEIDEKQWEIVLDLFEEENQLAKKQLEIANSQC